MEQELEQVIQLIQALYSPSTPPAQQVQLQQQLQQVQASPLAWSLPDPLLAAAESSAVDPSVRFFAASTLQLSITRSWDSLPSAQYEPLKQSLLGWLSSSAAAAYPINGQERQGERVVLRKLAGAVTSLSLRLALAEGDSRWEHWLLEAMARVGGPGTAREAVLEVLSVVVEQVARAELSGQKRISYMSTLSSSTPMIVSSLSSALSSPATPARELNAALGCFTSFLLAGQFAHPELTTLYPFLLPHLSNAETVITACSAVEELVERSSGLSGSVGVTRFVGRQKTEELVVGWATSDWVRNVVAEAVESEEADDEALAVMKLVCAITEHYISFLFSPAPKAAASLGQPGHLTLSSPPTIALLHLILSITHFPGHSQEVYNINELTSGVWMALQEESSDVGLVSGEGEGREGRDGHEHEWEVVKGVFGALVEGLRKRAERPTKGIVATWPKDVVDNFRVYRNTVVSETLLYCYYALRESMLGHLVSLAESQLAAAQPDSDDAYQALEATLFCIYAVHEAVSLPCPQHLPTLFGPTILGALPQSSQISLRSTALRLVGAYASWFSTETEACLAAVGFVVGGLEERELGSQAARALRGLCGANRKVLTGHVGSFVAVLGGLEGRIEDTELLKVLESVSSVVQALPEEQIIEPLLALSTPIVSKLSHAVQAFGQLPTESRDLILQQLNYLTACARGLSDPEGDLVDLDASFDDSQQVKEASARVISDSRVQEMRRALGGAIEGAARLWSGDAEVVQALSEYIRHSTSDAIPSPLALESFSLLTLSTSALQASPSSVWLSIAGSLVARLARDQSDHQISENDITRIGQPVQVALESVLTAHGDLASMEDNPDTVAAFFGFCSTIVRCYPRVFIALPSHLDAIIVFAKRGLGMQERFSLKATIDLLIATVQQTRMASPSSVIFKSTLLPHCTSIMETLLFSIGGAVPRSQLTSLSELLHALIMRLADESRGAMKELLARDGWPSAKASSEAKVKFERAVLSARTGKQCRQAVSDFAMVCRGLDGSAYGAASLSVFE